MPRKKNTEEVTEIKEVEKTGETSDPKSTPKKRTTGKKTTKESTTKMKDSDVETIQPTSIINKDGSEVPYEELKLTPADYFDRIKSLKEECDEDDLRITLSFAEKQLQKFKLLKQTEAASITNDYITMFQKEIKIIKAGFTTYVLKKDIEFYMNHLSDKAVFCCEIADYPREIPDPIFDKIKDHIDLFDHIYIIFTDYTQKISKAIDKKTREKDPIMFGAVDIKSSNYKPIPGPRYYFIGDWVDENCDLTLEQVIESYKEKENRDDVTKLATIPKSYDEYTGSVLEYSVQVGNNDGTSIVNYPNNKD